MTAHPVVDFFEQAYYRVKVPLFEWKEQQWVRKRFYVDPVFKALDQKLLSGPCPYHAARIFPYGETPLRAAQQMALLADLKPTDRFVDLGCGRGRAVFFLSRFFGCEATGIDLTPSFIHQAERLAHTYQQKKAFFYCQDFLTYDLSQATCVYLYGTTYSYEILSILEDRLKDLPIGSRVVTVSEPLYHLDPSHVTALEVSYPWGKGKLFLHTKISHTMPMFVLGQSPRGKSTS